MSIHTPLSDSGSCFIVTRVSNPVWDVDASNPDVELAKFRTVLSFVCKVPLRERSCSTCLCNISPKLSRTINIHVYITHYLGWLAYETRTAGNENIKQECWTGVCLLGSLVKFYSKSTAGQMFATPKRTTFSLDWINVNQLRHKSVWFPQTGRSHGGAKGFWRLAEKQNNLLLRHDKANIGFSGKQLVFSRTHTHTQKHTQENICTFRLF